MHRPRSTALIVLTAALLFSGAPSAVAEEGVTIDPGSPSGTEYQLPLQRAREEAAGSGSSGLSGSSSGGTQSGSASGASSEPPLFGVGVAKRTKSGGGTAAGAGTSKASGRASRGEGPAPHLSATRTEQLAAAGGSEGGATLTLLSGAAIVVVLGGLAGVILRGRRSGL